MNDLTSLNVRPSMFWNQSSFYVCIRENTKRKKVYIAAGTSIQRQQFKDGFKPVPTIEQEQALLNWWRDRQKQLEGEQIDTTKEETPFRALAQIFIAASSGRSEDWQKHIVSVLTKFCAEHGDKPISGITPLIVEKWIGEQKGWKKANTINTALKIFKAVLNYAVDRSIISRNQLKGKALPLRQSYAKHDYQITALDEEIIRRHTSAEFNRFFRFCLLTGCRPSEAARIEAAHCQEIDGTICVRFSIHKAGLKTGLPRCIEVSHTPEAEMILREVIRENPTGKLFRGKSGNSYARHCWVHTFVRLRDKKRIKDGFTFYSTKHTFITKALRNGVPVAVVAQWVGVTIAVIEKHYAHLACERKALLTTYGKLLNQKPELRVVS